MLSNINISWILLGVVWHRAVSFVDYRLKPDIQKWAPAMCNDENYQHVVRHGFCQVWWSMNIISTQSFSKFGHPKAAHVYQNKRCLGFWWISLWSGGSQNGGFSRINRKLMQFINSVLMFFLSNNSSFEPQHYLEYSCILYLPWCIPQNSRSCNYWSVV